MSLILVFTKTSLVLGFNCTNVCTELLPQLLSSIRYAHGKIYSKSIEELVGRSFKIPVTVKLSLSILITLFIASVVPNIFFAIFSVTTIEYTLFRTVLG